VGPLQPLPSGGQSESNGFWARGRQEETAKNKKHSTNPIEGTMEADQLRRYLVRKRSAYLTSSNGGGGGGGQAAYLTNSQPSGGSCGPPSFPCPYHSPAAAHAARAAQSGGGWPQDGVGVVAMETAALRVPRQPALGRWVKSCG
jgi:hypothetical protein